MALCQLKIFRGEDVSSEDFSSTSQQNISVSVGKVLPLLADAIASERTWLSDFEDDEITMSADLYEVLLAYQYLQRPSA